MGCAAFDARAAQAKPRVGIQLFMFLDAARADLAGTLKAIAALGFRHVELLAGVGGAKALKAALHQSGLSAPSIHVPPMPFFPGMMSLADGPEPLIELCRDVGIGSVVCSAPLLPDRLRPGPGAIQRDPKAFERAIAAMSMDDWAAHCDLLNRVGRQMAGSGLRLCYHNHAQEFAGSPGAQPYDLILARTEPDVVSMELDCGWAAVAGRDPTALLRAHPHRFRFLHLKDFVRDPSGEIRFVPLGQGSVDWRPILAQAARAAIDTAYVEQEPPFAGPVADAAAESFKYLARLGAV